MRALPLHHRPLTTAAALAVACVSTPQNSDAPSPSPAADSALAPPSPSVKAMAESGETAESEPVVVVVERATLASLEGDGFSFGELVFDARSRSGDELAKLPAYKTLVDTLARDLANDRQRDRAAGVGMRYAHRQFDVRWLTSARARFELVAVMNRLDRRPFAPGTCGEIRFVYRLAYSSERVVSRLPMTVNAVFWIPAAGDTGCQGAARAWMQRAPAREPIASWLRSGDGPLSPEAMSRLAPKSVEVNLQSVRWPSTVRPNMAGHAEYILRVFRRRGGALVVDALENTIDVDRIDSNGALRAELVRWLGEPQTLREVDKGTVVVPKEFLAERAVSVTPHGLARLQNRVYESALSPRALSALELGGYETFGSTAELLRRLDQMSCNGCHQSRSVAGFHLLGEDAADQSVDALATPISPHLAHDLDRRRSYVRALAAGRPANDYRPPAEDLGHRGRGARCAPGATAKGATCAEGLRCIAVADDDVGTCYEIDGATTMANGQSAPARPSVGQPCEYGPVVPSRDSHRDAVRLTERVSCADSRVCEANAVGFPSGMCAGGCANLGDGAVCGRIALLEPFNACLAAGRPFTECASTHTRPGALASCSTAEPCRDDYVCARLPDGNGACIPPYFLFQLRVDGHSL